MLTVLAFASSPSSSSSSSSPIAGGARGSSERESAGAVRRFSSLDEAVSAVAPEG